MQQHGALLSGARTRGDRLRALADELISLADAIDEPSRCTVRADMLIAEGERIAAATWSVFRGPRS